MRVGFDWGGVLDTYGDEFGQLLTALKATGHELYVVSACGEGELELRKQQVNNAFPDLFTQDHLITFAAPTDQQPQAKLNFVKEYGIDWFFDDRSDICGLLRENGCLAFVVNRDALDNKIRLAA
jgi:hypothetical protein